MSRLELTSGTSACEDDHYWVRVKVYSSISTKEKIIFEQKDVRTAEISTLLIGREQVLLQEIATISQKPSP
jgi:hypothetical protein